VTIHVVGAGSAGLACALALARGRGGHGVVLHEAAPQAGGRCRALPDGTDNGTHALLGANRSALRFLDAIGARDRWVEPEPGGLPVLDLADGTARRIALSPFAWARNAALRPPGLSAGAVMALARLALPGLRDRPVAAALSAHPSLHRALVEPLVVAALNTPSAEASSRLLGAVLRRLAAPGAARLLVARDGLGPDLVVPALAALRAARVAVRTGVRLRALHVADGRVTALDLGEDRIAVATGDAVVLALPPWEAVRLLPGLPAPSRFAPIVNLHFLRADAPVTDTSGTHPVRFIGLLGGLSQWVLVRPAGASVTISAADEAVQQDADTLTPRVWREVRAAALAFALPGQWPEAPPPCRVVKERRSTPRYGVGPAPAPPRRPLANLVLAGDWTLPALPATIEAAARSGEIAARAVAAIASAMPPHLVMQSMPRNRSAQAERSRP
jgi:phytoene dehydrogenase-like protein